MGNRVDRIWEKYPERKLQMGELVKRIRPIMWVDNKSHEIKRVDPFKTSFIWDPIRDREVKHLVKLEDITTYHTWGYYGFFKPSIAEVIAQIPQEHLSVVSHFETFTCGVALDGDYHCTTTRLYIGGIPIDWRDKLSRFLDKLFYKDESNT